MWEPELLAELENSWLGRVRCRQALAKISSYLSFVSIYLEVGIWALHRGTHAEDLFGSLQPISLFLGSRELTSKGHPGTGTTLHGHDYVSRSLKVRRTCTGHVGK